MTDEKYKLYIEERKQLINAELEQARHFDKYILTLASGTFGLSLLFIKQIAPNPESGTIWLLVVAWVTFGLSILSTLISFLLSQEACSKQRKTLKEWYKKDTCDEMEEINNPFTIWTNKLNWFSMGMFIIGVSFLTIFVVFNMH